MSLEQKIAELMEQAKQLEAIKTEEVPAEETFNEEEVSEQQIDERAKWRSTSVAKKVTDPNGEDSVSYDYHHDNPRSTGNLRPTSDTKDRYGSLSTRPPAQVAQSGPRKGMITKQHAERLKARIKARHQTESEYFEPTDEILDEMSQEEFNELVTLGSKRNESYEGYEKIDLGNLFEGEQFSEEFKAAAQEMFEAAVEARVKQEVAALAEELVDHSLTESEELKEGLVDKVDGYLNYVVEQWMNENALALDRGIKLEIFESFVSGMKDLLESHYIDVPEEKFDLMEAVDAKAKTLEEKLDEATAEIVSLKAKLKEIAKEKQIQEACEGLSDLEAERFKQLAEELAYDDEEGFAKKLDVIKENMVKSPKQKTIVESVVTDSPVELKEETQIDPTMARYLKAIR
jgi:hypothetical protein